MGGELGNATLIERTANISNGVATIQLDTTNMPTGTYNIQATYSQTNNYKGSTGTGNLTISDGLTYIISFDDDGEFVFDDTDGYLLSIEVPVTTNNSSAVELANLSDIEDYLAEFGIDSYIIIHSTDHLSSEDPFIAFAVGAYVSDVLTDKGLNNELAVPLDGAMMFIADGVLQILAFLPDACNFDNASIIGIELKANPDGAEDATILYNFS